MPLAQARRGTGSFSGSGRVCFIRSAEWILAATDTRGGLTENSFLPRPWTWTVPILPNALQSIRCTIIISAPHGQVCRGLPFVTTYLDDVLVHSANDEDHEKEKMRGKKCHIGMSKVAYLGHVFSSEGMKPDPQKSRSGTHPPMSVASTAFWDLPPTIASTSRGSQTSLPLYTILHQRELPSIGTWPVNLHSRN